jgi:hypothetical protein
MPSRETNEATRREWRELGFYYESSDEPPRWRIVGSIDGLGGLARLLDSYVRDPRNDRESEHEHYGPYMYFKVQTANEPAIDADGIRGSLRDLVRLRDLIAARLAVARPGDRLVIGAEYAAATSHPLHLEARADDFDPASEDVQLAETDR